MISEITAGVKISIITNFESQFSSPGHNMYLFSYEIFIENHNNFRVQLLSRYWKITDSSGEIREVKGEGVIGKQPILKPFGSFSYQSSCDFKTDAGKMQGTYTLKNLENNNFFEVKIPAFKMIVPYRLN
jgi:ApaG protein